MNYKKMIYNSSTLRDYATDFIKYDTIFTKAPMGFGKTKNLINLLDSPEYKNKKIIIVSFRRSLMRQYKKALPNFSYYAEIKDRKIDLDLHEKLIIQADSLYRIRGNTDMLVMDECTYTLDHLVTYVKKFKTQCVDALEHLLHTSGKVLAIDALFTEDYVDIFKQYRKNILYAVNTYKFHQNKNVVMYNNDLQIFYNRMMECIRGKEKIVICTNSKVKLNYFEDKIRKEFPSLSCLFMDGDHEVDYDIDDWKDKDVIGYTPTITAGVSFEIEHFDRCFGYFVSGSSNASLSIQQLFRVRNLSKNQFNICVDVTASSNYPVEYDDLDNAIEERNSALVDGHEILDINYGDKVINKDTYYYLYRTVLKYNNMSKNNYQKKLVRHLESQGITNITFTGKQDKNLNKLRRIDYKTFKEQKEEQNSISVTESELIDSEMFESLCNKEKLSRSERNSVMKYSFLDQTKINPKKLTSKIYQEYKPKLAQFHNLTYIKNNKDRLSEKINKRNAYNDYCKRDGKSVEILHTSKKYEKMKLLNDTVKELGWVDLNDTASIEIRVNYSKLIPILRKMESVFSTSRHEWDINHRNIRTATLRYINSRLKSVFDMVMMYDKNTKKYVLGTISSWNFINEYFYLIKESLDEKETKFDDKVDMDIIIHKIMNDTFNVEDLKSEELNKVDNKEEYEYIQSDHMDYINMYKAKNKDRLKNKNKNKVKPNRRVKVYKDSYKNTHKGPAFIIEEIEKWDKEGSIHKNMDGVYEGLDIDWSDPNYEANITGAKAFKLVQIMFDIDKVSFSDEGSVSHTLNGYRKEDISTIGREQMLWGGDKSIYESDSEEEPEFDLY